MFTISLSVLLGYIQITCNFIDHSPPDQDSDCKDRGHAIMLFVNQVSSKLQPTIIFIGLVTLVNDKPEPTKISAFIHFIDHSHIVLITAI